MQNVSRLLACFIALIFVFQLRSAEAQEKTLSDNPDSRLIEAFGNERVDFLKRNNPDLIRYFNFFLDNAFQLVQHPAEKIEGIIKSCPMLELNDPSMKMDKPDMSKGTKSINILKYNFQLVNDKVAQYRLDNSGIIIVFLPANEITKKFNEAQSHKN